MGRASFHSNCQCFNIPNNFQPTVKRQIFLSCSEKQWQRREEALGSIWDRTSVPSAHAFSRVPAHACTRRHACTLRLRTLRQRLRQLGISEEEKWARETTATSLFGPAWDSLHRKPAVHLRATCSRPDNTFVGGMPSCLCGRRVSSPSTINFSSDPPKLCRFNPRHH